MIKIRLVNVLNNFNLHDKLLKGHHKFCFGKLTKIIA
jgi:hypothetical protein